MRRHINTTLLIGNAVLLLTTGIIIYCIIKQQECIKEHCCHEKMQYKGVTQP